jgi:ABC-type polysaccharide/polyol phosphate transport system ATPase subunit
MDQQTAIVVEHISKSYKLYNSPKDRLKEVIHPLGKSYHRNFFALDDISFEIPRGETFGIIGKNGSGKSTLLKIISGVLSPSSGNLVVNGKVSALLELGAGFNPELSGIENVYLNGTIMGYTREEVDKRMDEVLSFADIGEFISQPVKTYSSGMYVRLAFSVATSIIPDILIVDEALSVGDMFFQTKCMKRMTSLIEDYGTTLLFVSHEMSAVKRMCRQAVYLREGRVRSIGTSGDIADMYISDQRSDLGLFKPQDDEASAAEDTEQLARQNHQQYFTAEDAATFARQAEFFRHGNGMAQILFAELVDERGNRIVEACYGQKLSVRLYYRVTADRDELVAAFYVRDHHQIEIMGSNNIYEDTPLTDLKAGVVYCAEYRFDNWLKSGNFHVKLILADRLPTTQFLDVIDSAIVFHTADLPERTRWALVNPPIEFSHSCLDETTDGALAANCA